MLALTLLQVLLQASRRARPRSAGACCSARALLLLLLLSDGCCGCCYVSAAAGEPLLAVLLTLWAKVQSSPLGHPSGLRASGQNLGREAGRWQWVADWAAAWVAEGARDAVSV